MSEAGPVSVHAGIDAQQFASLEKLLGTKNAQVAAQRAVSRTITTLVARISREIRKAVHISSKLAKAQITAKRGSQRDPSGTVSVTRKAISLFSYLKGSQRTPGRQARGGMLKATIRKRASGAYGAGAQNVPGAFVITGPKGTVTAVERLATKAVMTRGRYKGKLRHVLRRKQGPTALGVFIHAAGERAGTIMQETVKDAREVLAKNLLQQISGAQAGVKGYGPIPPQEP